MTVGSDVKQCLSSLKSAKHSLSSLELRTKDKEDKKTLSETVAVIEEIVEDMKSRVGTLEWEEEQYKGF